MIHDTELSELLKAIAEKSLQIISDIQKTPLQLSIIINQYIELTEHFQNVMSILLKNPEKIWQMQLAYWQDAFNLAQIQLEHWLEGKPMPIDDPRFREEDWLNNPFFNMMLQHYLLASQHMNNLFKTVEYPDQNTAKRLQFFTRQYLDALSPANFLHTNPQIMDETLKSRGKNLLRGLHNLLSDLEVGSSRLMIKMTDMEAFKLGENLAITPGKVIFRNNMMELIQYTPQTTKVKSIPLLIIPPWINKYYILDLSPHNSLVRWLVKQGITVFMISWVNPDASFSHKSLYDYLNEGPITAIKIIQKQLHVNQVNTMGFCIGGTLLSMLLAYNKACQDNSIHSATFLASMIDFSDPGDISVFIDEQQIIKLEDEMKSKGYLAGKFMASSFNSLRANDLIWSFFIKNYLRGKNPVPFDILYWNSDCTNMPATMHSQYLRWMYLHNNLSKPGKIHLNHIPIDVTRVDIPTFFLSTEKDHIAPWKTTYIGFQLMKGPKRFVLGGSGHIAGIINAPEAKKYGYKVNDHSPPNADQWLEQATEHPGSWWPEWLKWLKSHSGKLIPAPVFEQLPLTPLMDAPGNYVLKK
ncbi:PHA/PHB synthase family protein [Legionella longbeachae]|uniref:Putative poly-beta-hydroxybutyrate synthase n=1 Tax=Legionella longbeachae serogroup 1 (strain NSW150) TaxID=661367 RepID=D3HL40_LEGLN|nr:class I poly(R)-hydroxyalkanoic acid synthase [Legionella longbeachae]VEE03666.1 poly-beta-hydroxybutyrate synthase [Legionella oakridgensis]HBD7397528.1 class I poly(R)-hydroxyalkanoic acid synthase [Legionella pneumophila]ARB93451.1 class I poly(R)-hydroxyalkanoic acid synthase [Legionella longbeachae]ARM33445.1 class I poly(R)-hydroxyalkanoic acid synthase [Legionella longbeachae]EEZ93707.1 poly(3-hydroxyalkanoate) polymerase [Legionella longbeachae D-4968]